ncbi:MAG: DNA ligase D [Acidobacteriota bacterium]|nr:DNA ligase D [Acidobacteriota bacterium]
MPDTIAPMAATLVNKPPKGDDWVFEIKWDGIRAICFIDNGELRIQSRAGNRCERQYPELTVLPNRVSATQAILDAEIAVLDERGISSFASIQPRITNRDANAVAQMARKNPVTLFAFDLLYLDGYDLRKVPLLERKRLLEAVLKTDTLIRLSDHFATDGEQMLEAARQQGLEGLIAKCTTSVYESRRSRNWLKLKLVQQQEFVICGYTVGERDHFGALVLGLYEKGKLVWAGNVGTGFDNKMLAAVHERLDRLTVAKSAISNAPKIPGGVVWVRPEVACEVKFLNWTRDGRLRAPVFLGLRLDVDAKDCARERVDDAGETVPATEPAVQLLPGKENAVTIAADGQELKLTNLNKIYYPEDGYTKRDLLNYYDAVSSLLLPHLKDRPLSLKRYPNGIRDEFFFQKNSPGGFPSWFRIEQVDNIRYALAKDRASLLYLTNLGCIDQNPWMSRTGSLENPDFILIDLDPHGCEYDRIVEAAQLVRKKLDAVGLEGYPKTTGGDGMHIYVPVEPRYTYEQTKAFAEVLARLAASERPDLFTTPRSVAKRENGKVYFDYLQNGEGKTIAAPYVVRAYPGAPVATPLAWREVCPGLLPTQFTIRNAVARFERTGDLFESVLKKPQTLEGSLVKLEKLLRS